MGVSKIIESKAFIGFLIRTLNPVDTQLVNRGIRVSYIVYHMLKASDYKAQYILNVALTALGLFISKTFFTVSRVCGHRIAASCECR